MISGENGEVKDVGLQTGNAK